MNARPKHDETKLTDYALGELRGTALDDVETLLETDLEARAEVDEIAHVSKLLRGATACGGAPAVDTAAESYAEIVPNPGLRAALLERLAESEAASGESTHLPDRSKSPLGSRRLHDNRLGTFTALAASVAVIAAGLGGTAWFTSQNKETAQSPQHAKPTGHSNSARLASPAADRAKVSNETTPSATLEDLAARDESKTEQVIAGKQLAATATAIAPTPRPLIRGGIVNTSPVSQIPAGTLGDGFVPYVGDLQMFDQPVLNGRGVQPPQGRYGEAQYLNWGMPGERSAAGSLPPLAGRPLSAAVTNRPAPVKLGVGSMNVAGTPTTPVSGSGGVPLSPQVQFDYFGFATQGGDGAGQKTNAPPVVTFNPQPAGMVGPIVVDPQLNFVQAGDQFGTVPLKSELGRSVVDSRRGVVVTAQPMFTPIPPVGTFNYVAGPSASPDGTTLPASISPPPLPATPLAATPAPPQPDFDGLVNLMTTTIQPEAWRWREAGGTQGVIREQSATLGLTITQTQTLAKEAKETEVAGIRADREFGERLGREVERLKALEEQELRQKEIDRIEQLRRENPEFDTESYASIVENPFVRTTDAPLSTFSIDVDTASYSNVRRFLNGGNLPPRGAVRLEEFVNYFTYDYPQPEGEEPFSVVTEAARCPWNAHHVLVRIGLKGREVHRKERPATNLVFLVDVSGSMQDANKLPLVRESLKMMVRELNDSDRVSIVVYAGNEGLALGPTGGNRKQTILEAIDRLDAGGSTNGAAGITLAYQLAAENFIKNGVNRVVLATDGDFNVGTTSEDELVRLIEDKAKSGVFFTALGYGMGNIKDSTLEKLADKGNGNYAYIDSLAEARKVLVEQMSGTLVTIAKDVKIQIEFNPTRVAGYRLLGYENRMLAAQDFNDDKKDAGEIGAGHTVTAIYELMPIGVDGAKEAGKLPTVDPLKYQQPQPATTPTAAAASNELLTLKLRYKEPDGDASKLIERPLADNVQPYARASGDFKFAAAVAGFGMLLRDSEFKGTATYDAVLELGQEGLGRDEAGYRAEFLELVRKAKTLAGR